MRESTYANKDSRLYFNSVSFAMRPKSNANGRLSSQFIVCHFWKKSNLNNYRSMEGSWTTMDSIINFTASLKRSTTRLSIKSTLLLYLTGRNRKKGQVGPWTHSSLKNSMLIGEEGFLLDLLRLNWPNGIWKILIITLIFTVLRTNALAMSPKKSLGSFTTTAALGIPSIFSTQKYKRPYSILKTQAFLFHLSHQLITWLLSTWSYSNLLKRFTLQSKIVCTIANVKSSSYNRIIWL